ncbi:MAG: hypothetical protein WA810_12775 [Maribacter sp.]
MMLWGCFSLVSGYAQEEPSLDIEQSAEVFLENYSDEFQENFFEGLKQKGIQNYDRSITYFLECKRLEPKNMVVAFELAKANLLDNELIGAQEYAVESVNGDPENYWYAETLTDVVDARKSDIAELTTKLPWDNTMLRGNIAEIYFKKGEYETAKTILKGIKESKKYTFLENRILDSIASKQSKTQSVTFTIPTGTDNEGIPSGAEQYKTRIRGLMNNDVFSPNIKQISEEAMELYPTQPYFYYANGYALNRTLKHKDAIAILENALDYLVSDSSLENKIYKELVDAYTAVNNSSKANMYLRKIKPGF